MLCCKATLALSKYLDSARGQPHLNLFLRKPVQHAVIMPLDIDMVIGADRDPRIIAGGCSSQTRVATMRHSPQSELENSVSHFHNFGVFYRHAAVAAISAKQWSNE
jgi:hypothetical protein